MGDLLYGAKFEDIKAEAERTGRPFYLKDHIVRDMSGFKSLYVMTADGSLYAVTDNGMSRYLKRLDTESKRKLVKRAEKDLEKRYRKAGLM